MPDEHVGVLRFDLKAIEHLYRKISDVTRHDHTGAGDDCRCEHVPIVRIGQGERPINGS